MARKSPAQEAVALQIEFSPIGRTRVRVTFDEPELSSDRLRLLKVAARVQTGRTFVRFHLPVACPAAAAFGRTAALASAGRVT